MAKSVGNIALLHEVARRATGRDALVMFFARRALPPADRLLRRARWPGGRAACARIRDAARRLAPGASPAGPGAADASAFFDALADDFNTPDGARARCSSGCARPTARERRAPATRRPARDARRARPRRTCSRPTTRPPDGGVRAARASARRRAPRATSPRADALRDELRRARLGGPRRRPAAPSSMPAATGDPLRPQPRARGAARPGAGRSTEVWATEGAAREPWLRGRPRCASSRRGRIRAPLRLATPTRASAPRPGAYPYADAPSCWRAADAADRRARRDPGPAEPRRDLPHGRVRGRGGRGDPRAPRGRGHAGRVQGVGGRGRAPARSRACATSPTSSATAKAARLLVLRGGRRAARAVPTTSPTTAGGVVLVLGRRGEGLRPRVADACDELVALPLRGRVGSLNVSAAAAALLYEILQRSTNRA